MKESKYILPLIVVALLSSCSATVNVQKDDNVNLNKYHTYMWVDTKSGENDNTARAVSYADIPVRNAANSELKKKGWSEVTDNPDVLISYDILVERSTEQKSDPVYSQGYTRSYYNPRTKRWQSIYYPSQFLGYQNYEVPVKEGTVTITMVDADTDKTVWQGWTTESLNYSKPSADDISSSVRSIFHKLDVANK
ncbi:MAG: DUF4136 domain-containing protein [Ferruginibacter sp.]